MHVQEEPVDLYACRMSRLDCPREPALHWAVLLWRVRRRQLAADLEIVTVLHERRLSVLGAVIRPERSWNSHVCHEPLHHTEDGRCALVLGPVRALKREALSTNMTTCREPPNGPAVSMWSMSSGAAARDVVRCGVSAQMPFNIEHPEHGASSPTS